MVEAAERNPRYHTQRMRQRLEETISHLREDIDKVSEPQLRAMFETSSEVLGGLVKAFHDREQRNESACVRNRELGRNQDRHQHVAAHLSPK